MAVIICKSCQQSVRHYGRGLCQSCYQRQFRVTQITYFQAYRSRPEYPEQRRQYDIRYLLRQAKSDAEKREE